MRGRKPKPAELKILEGVRSDRINDASPKPPPGVPDCPGHLDDDARDEWDRIVPQLEAMGVLARTDGSALALYCDAYSQWVRANGQIAREGLTVDTLGGGLKAHPAVAIARNAGAQMHRLLVEFGCTPSSRSRLKAGGDDGPNDAFAEFMSKRKA